MLFETPVGNYEYRTIKQELFFGYRIIQLGEYHIKLAEAEKAILDFFYFNKINDLKSIKALRFNQFVAKEIIQKDKLMEYSTVFKSKIMNSRIKLFLNYLNA